MKKYMAILAVAFLSSTAALMAQTEAPTLAGVWQQHQYVPEQDGSARLIHLPVWKVLTADGNFCTFLIANKEGVSIKTNEGTYKVLNDSVYEETLTGSITVPDLVGQSNSLRYEFQDPDTMNLIYTLPNKEAPTREIWTRVKLEFPKNH